MNYVAYYRVSTIEQGISGLGLEAQADAVRKYVASQGGELIGEFTDIQSGKDRNRAGLRDAVQQAGERNAILIVKSLDRLSRGGLRVLTDMEEKGIKFVESDSPHDTDLVKEIKLSIARDEARRVSVRTTAALQVIKDKLFRGETHTSKAGKVITSLGKEENLCRQPSERVLSARAARAADNENNRRAGAFITALAGAGLSMYAITKKLNEGGFKTSTGKEFTETQTKRVYERYRNE